MRNYRVLVLNADYMAFQIVSWRRAIMQTVMNAQDPTTGAEIVDFYRDGSITDTRGRQHPIPAVIRLAKYVKRVKEKVPFSRKNIFIRDDFTCQYCGSRKTWDELNLDHVTPRVKWDIAKLGTPTVWGNIVTSCYPCNNKKGSKTLKEAGMKLLREPKTPKGLSYVIGLTPWQKFPAEWKPYLPPYYTNVSTDGSYSDNS